MIVSEIESEVVDHMNRKKEKHVLNPSRGKSLDLVLVLLRI